MQSSIFVFCEGLSIRRSCFISLFVIASAALLVITERVIRPDVDFHIKRLPSKAEGLRIHSSQDDAGQLIQGVENLTDLDLFGFEFDTDEPNHSNSTVEIELEPLGTDEKSVNTHSPTTKETFNASDPVLCQRESVRHLQPGTPSGPRLQFLHIPKAGGTAVQMSMKYDWRAKPSQVCLTDTHDTGINNSSFMCVPCALRSSILLGHRGFGYCGGVEADKKRGLVVFTVLRIGWTRALSHYDYSFEKWPHQLARIFGRREDLAKNIKEYNRTTDIEEPGEKWLKLRGHDQVRFLCGYDCDGPNAVNNATLTVEFMMTRAKANLERIAMVGVMEQLDNIIPQIRFQTTLLPPSFKKWPVMNTLQIEKSPLDDEALAILKMWAAPDQELYDMAISIAKRKTAIALHCCPNCT